MSTLNATTVNATTIKSNNFQNSSSIPGFTVDTSGRILRAAQPHAAVKGPESSTTVTNLINLNFNNAFTNIGGHFNTANYRFTCPVTGSYLITASIFITSASGRLSIKVNNAAYQNMQTNLSGTWGTSVIWRLNANDYVTIGDWQSISGGQVYMGHSHFCCYLLG